MNMHFLLNCRKCKFFASLLSDMSTFYMCCSLSCFNAKMLYSNIHIPHILALLSFLAME